MVTSAFPVDGISLSPLSLFVHCDSGDVAA
jgi:hypothetical protein